MSNELQPLGATYSFPIIPNTVSPENVALRAAIIKEIASYRPQNEEGLHILEGGFAGREFLNGLLISWVERVDDADAWAVLDDDGYGPDFDDRLDFHNELADNAASGLVYNYDIAQAWLDLQGWYYEPEDEYGEGTGPYAKDGASETIARMQVGLCLIAGIYLQAVHNVAVAAAADYLDGLENDAALTAAAPDA